MSGDLGIPSDYGRKRGLKLLAEATDLVSIGENPEGKDVRLTPAAARAWGDMRDDAFEAGITLVPVSGFRSIVRQEEIIRAKLEAGQAIDDILRTVAAPGYSEHHTGRAIDIGAPGEPPLTELFAETPTFSWLEEHAPERRRSGGHGGSDLILNRHGVTAAPRRDVHDEAPFETPDVGIEAEPLGERTDQHFGIGVLERRPDLQPCPDELRPRAVDLALAVKRNELQRHPRAQNAVRHGVPDIQPALNVLEAYSTRGNEEFQNVRCPPDGAQLNVIVLWLFNFQRLHYRSNNSRRISTT